MTAGGEVTMVRRAQAAGGIRSGGLLRVRTLAVVLGINGCAADRTVAPFIPPAPPATTIKPLAFTADIDLQSGRVVIAAPAASTRNGPTLSIDGNAQAPSLSLLGGEAVRLVPSNYQASAVGAYAPNKVRVTFDVVIENKLPGVALVSPTWPAPPAAGVILFPIDYVVTTTPGGAIGGTGNEIIVELPGSGIVVPSIDWDGTGAAGSGSAYNFFNDAACDVATSNDCFRWEAYPGSIAPLSGSTAHTIGFDIDASVAQFRARLVVAADLAPAATATPGSVSGTVTSPIRGPLAGVMVMTSSGLSATTDALGQYAIAAANPGAITVSTTNLPAGCTAPAPLAALVVSATNTIADVAVACTGLPGTISGRVTSSVGGVPIPGARITTAGLSAVADSTGAYTLSGVPQGAGTLVISNLFAGCTATDPAFVLPNAGTQTVDVAASCPVPPGAGYQFSTAWFAGAGGTIELEVRLDMRTFNRADVADTSTTDGSGDPVRSVQVSLAFDTAQLVLQDVRPVALPDVVDDRNATPGQLTVTASATSGRTGNVGVVRLVFARGTIASAGASVAVTVASVSALSGGGVDVSSDIVRMESAYVLPP